MCSPHQRAPASVSKCKNGAPISLVYAYRHRPSWRKVKLAPDCCNTLTSASRVPSDLPAGQAQQLDNSRAPGSVAEVEGAHREVAAEDEPHLSPSSCELSDQPHFLFPLFSFSSLRSIDQIAASRSRKFSGLLVVVVGVLLRPPSERIGGRRSLSLCTSTQCCQQRSIQKSICVSLCHSLGTPGSKVAAAVTRCTPGRAT